MKKIEELDRNFASAKSFSCFEYQHLWDIPQVSVTGLYPNTFCRMDPDQLTKMSAGVQELAWHTAGGAILFSTKCGRFGIRMQLLSNNSMTHMPLSGSSGLDIYVGAGSNCRFLQNARPEVGKSFLEAECMLPPGEQDVTIYLPLYNGITSLELGFPAGENPSASVVPPRGHAVFYGSSITQGGCASRPGNCYIHMLSRMLNCSTHNLGFSGNAKGEPEMAEYISSLSMDVLVLDYDHNAITAEDLRNTHLPFLKRIQHLHPGLPVLFVTKPDFYADPAASVRRDIIHESYEWLRGTGVPTAFVDGEKLFDGFMRDSCTVDGCHPNDLGFYRMAEKIGPALDMLLPKP